jgi:hypothetical protein
VSSASDDQVSRYLRLGLRLGRHVDGFVDAYYGPGELAAQVESEPLVAPDELVQEAAALAGELELGDERREAWLRAQLGGCETTARRLWGESIAWGDEVERCYGVRPESVPDENFAAAYERLDATLPGSGALAARYRAWADAQVVPADRLLAAAAALQRELRARTEALVGLPPGESVELGEVSGEPWTAFNQYLGGRRSRVEINVDLPMYAFSLPALVAHETYPGHHTEFAWKETLLVDRAGFLEETILLVGTPQALVSEGIAMLALDVALGDDADAVSERVLAGVGVDYEAESARAVREFRKGIGGLRVNAARGLHEDGWSRDEAVEYVRRWSLETHERAAGFVEFIVHPTWRAYASCYTSGHELCARFVAGDVERFRRLLTEQFTTGDLVALADRA